MSRWAITASRIDLLVWFDNQRATAENLTYVSFGDMSSRSWADALQYGFISAGGGSCYSQTLKLLSPGDRVWVKTSN